MWVRSYRAFDFVQYSNTNTISHVNLSYGITSDKGKCKIGWVETNSFAPRGFMHSSGNPFDWTGEMTFWNRIGFGWGSAKDQFVEGQHVSYQSILFPYWGVVALGAGVPSARRWWNVRRRTSIKNPFAPKRVTGTWVRNPRISPLVTPVILLSVGLVLGFFAVCGAIDLIMMAFGLIRPEFGLVIVTLVLGYVTRAVRRLRRRVKRQ